MLTIVTLVGISLLIEYVNSLLENNNYQLPHDFIKYLDAYDQDRDRRSSKIVMKIKPDKMDRIVPKLLDVLSPGTEVAASAETNSIFRILKEDDRERHENVRFYFLASNTAAGRICSQALYEYYRTQRRGNWEIKQPIVIEKLKSETLEQGFRQLIDQLSKIVGNERKEDNTAIINATGGFKPEIAYATLCGILQDATVTYIHEEFDRPVRLPPVPIHFDLGLWHRNASKIKLRLSGVDVDLAPELENLFDGNYFTPLGEVLWNAYLASVSGRSRVTPQITLLDKLIDEHKQRILEYIKAWDSLWTGDQVSQMVDHQQNHCQDVLNLADEALIPILDQDPEFLGEEERYYLVSCIFLHDIGHTEIKHEAGGLLTLEQIRKSHGELTYQRIKNNPQDFGFDSFDKEAKFIATLCKYHLKKYDLTELPTEGNGTRPRLIVTLLKIFDACDCQVGRAGDEHFRNMRLHANDMERKICEELLKEHPKGEVEKYLEDKIAFISVQRDHFDLHGRISLVRIEPKKKDNKWELTVIYHPCQKGNDLNEFAKIMTGELDAKGVKSTLDHNLLHFRIRKGECVIR